VSAAGPGSAPAVGELGGQAAAQRPCGQYQDGRGYGGLAAGDPSSQLGQAVRGQGPADVPHQVRHRRRGHPQTAEGAQGEVQGHSQGEGDIVAGQVADGQAEQGQGEAPRPIAASMASHWAALSWT
jgi:hypothetical protein